MAITVSEQYDQGTFTEDESSSTLTRIWLVKCVPGDSTCIDTARGIYLAPYVGQGIPWVGTDYITIPGIPHRRLFVTSVTGKRFSPQSVLVTAVYKWQGGPDGEVDLRTKNVVFDEKLVVAGQQVTEIRDLDGAPIGPDGKGISVHKGMGSWSFKVLTTYQNKFARYVGRVNSDRYPNCAGAPQPQPHATFRFLPGQLLYLGFNVARPTKPLREPDHLCWEYSFQFAFFPRSKEGEVCDIHQADIGDWDEHKWEYYYWTIQKNLEAQKLPVDSRFRYIDVFDPDPPNAGTEKQVDAIAASAKAPIFIRNVDNIIWLPWHNRIRYTVPFHRFPFNWVAPH